MAEAVLFTVASKILSTLASPTFEKAYERACSIRNARGELNKLKTTIHTIQAVLLDAERKQNDSDGVKIWIKRVKDVLYDAEDLFDEVTTDDMLRQPIKGSKFLKKVRVSFSQLNPIISNNSVAKKVKAIRESLLEISEDMKVFNFVVCRDEKPINGMREGQDPGSFVDPKNVIGRDKDKKAILKMLLHESNDAQQDVQVIAIVGIGGMGKTTLSQLVYNHGEVKNNFEKRWFACISDSSSDTEVFGKILQSISGTYNGNFTLDVMQTKIKESTEGEKFLLVLDDVWDDDRGRWQNRMSLLDSGAKGSKIIISTRSSLVARAMGALETHNLCGLSKEDSWDLFKSVVNFTPEQEEDSRWTELGREIVKKCANVPLAIKSIASLLFEKNTIQEWESIRNEELPQLGESHKDGIMPVLKLSYEHLPSNLKHCFAYCSLIPKDRVFVKEELINIWIAQGYINPNNEKQSVEDVGHSYFMHLLRRSFFMEFISRGFGDIGYVMHDLIHDLAKHVAGKESLMLTKSSNIISGVRHVSVGYTIDNTWVLPEPLYNVNRLRSFLFLPDNISGSRMDLGNLQFANLKSLRALKLQSLRIENVPSSIGELKRLRYLDISENNFKELPNSITKLVNLCTLNISQCENLEVLPNNFEKLINLRHLRNDGCWSLKHMPAGFEELVSLQQLDVFKVGNGMGGAQRSKLDVLPRLKLRGDLRIDFTDDTDDWDGVECWQPPLTLQELSIIGYKGMRIPHWGNGRAPNPSLLSKLTSLSLDRFRRVKCLPPFRHIPNIKKLHIFLAGELEYIEEEELGSNVLFIPDLKQLELHHLPKLKGWSRKVESADPEHHSPQLFSFPSLSCLRIHRCPELKSMLQCPRLQTMSLESACAKQIQQLHHLLPISESSSASTTSSSCLEHVYIDSCDELTSFSGESLASLKCLHIHKCIKLKKVDLPPFHLNNLEDLALKGCPELELWEEKKRGVDWDSLPKLRRLTLDEAQSSERLPGCLRRGQELGKLDIESCSTDQALDKD